MNKKNKYETPVIIPLGELARGSGVCMNGGIPNPSPAQCVSGPGTNNCSMGDNATINCGSGPNAKNLKPCTSGVGP